MKNYNYAYEINGFEDNPLLKKLVREYVLYNCDENADLSENGLWREYLYLIKHNNLNVLFESEKRGSSARRMMQNDAVV